VQGAAQLKGPIVPEAHIILETPIVETPRVLQVRGIFDLERQATSRVRWDVALPLDARPWNIGLIVGPSGCGKSTIARYLFGDVLAAQYLLDEWPEDRAIVDAFPETMPVKDVVALLSSVGFASPPAWVRPFRVLSTGQQFRARLARLLACFPAMAVVDEYTSVVDRTVAQVGSAALAKTVRQRRQKFIAVTCHEDVEQWLQPDWTYRPAENAFQWRCLQRRPAVTLRIFRCRHAAWRLFHHHHYLSGELARGSVCFLAEWQGRPVAFSAWVNALTRRGGKREHRTVTLPDYQGMGIGHALSGFCASLWKGLGERATSTTTHPAFVATRMCSPDWRLVRRPTLAGSGERRPIRHATTRLTAGFEYVGPALDPAVARRLLIGC
jgi:ABC-type lipoprotein export system ATPase subunit/GNAT superfamily N-acetyltransferase